MTKTTQQRKEESREKYEAIRDKAWEDHNARIAEIEAEEIPDTIIKDGITYKRV